jgi:hypothetical protein
LVETSWVQGPQRNQIEFDRQREGYPSWGDNQMNGEPENQLGLDNDIGTGEQRDYGMDTFDTVRTTYAEENDNSVLFANFARNHSISVGSIGRDVMGLETLWNNDGKSATSTSRDQFMQGTTPSIRQTPEQEECNEIHDWQQNNNVNSNIKSNLSKPTHVVSNLLSLLFPFVTSQGVQGIITLCRELLASKSYYLMLSLFIYGVMQIIYSFIIPIISVLPISTALDNLRQLSYTMHNNYGDHISDVMHHSDVKDITTYSRNFFLNIKQKVIAVIVYMLRVVLVKAVKCFNMLSPYVSGSAIEILNKAKTNTENYINQFTHINSADDVPFNIRELISKFRHFEIPLSTTSVSIMGGLFLLWTWFYILLPLYVNPAIELAVRDSLTKSFFQDRKENSLYLQSKSPFNSLSSIQEYLLSPWQVTVQSIKFVSYFVALLSCTILGIMYTNSPFVVMFSVFTALAMIIELYALGDVSRSSTSLEDTDRYFPAHYTPLNYSLTKSLVYIVLNLLMICAALMSPCIL